ncbi:DUF4238 domain-containing protein [Leptospira saintgironsiae]|uniref:DUF4238 domain-containing protein n=1 Tax=Leptospira saintgironsiae TaxID=2023183 RepID=A0A2M9Y7B1_9LEPT|nr:DUF4238 domain-containing protein [Leptospira saintgironsiae]PJZ47465.1 hypothetical protein CH362_19065 [Leptospira saintgironsiae]
MSEKQHYVPRIVINGFLDPSSLNKSNVEPYTWISEKKSNAKKRAASNILWERNLYTQYDSNEKEDQALEKFFSTNLEKPFGTFKRIFETDLLNLNINNLEKNGLWDTRPFINSFVFWHWKRTTKFINEIKEAYISELLQDNPKHLVEKYVTTKSMQNDLIDTLINAGDQFEGLNIQNLLSKRNITFTVITNKSASFINSDNPVLRTNENRPNGVIYPDTELSMPLTSKIAVTLIGEQSLMQVRGIRESKIIRKINQSLAKNSNEIIFGSSESLINSLVGFTKPGAIA